MNAQTSFIPGTSGAEKLLRINSGGLANRHSRDQCLQLSRRWHSLKSGAFINGGMGLSIEASLFVGLEGVPDLLMQFKIVLEDIIADMFKVIRELRLFRHSLKPKSPPRFPNVKTFIALLVFDCALVYINSKCTAWQDLDG